jgi:hypothetical protein
MRPYTFPNTPSIVVMCVRFGYLLLPFHEKRCTELLAFHDKRTKWMVLMDTRVRVEEVVSLPREDLEHVPTRLHREKRLDHVQVSQVQLVVLLDLDVLLSHHHTLYGGGKRGVGVSETISRESVRTPRSEFSSFLSARSALEALAHHWTKCFSHLLSRGVSIWSLEQKNSKIWHKWAVNGRTFWICWISV